MLYQISIRNTVILRCFRCTKKLISYRWEINAIYFSTGSFFQSCGQAFFCGSLQLSWLGTAVLRLIYSAPRPTGRIFGCLIQRVDTKEATKMYGRTSFVKIVLYRSMQKEPNFSQLFPQVYTGLKYETFFQWQQFCWEPAAFQAARQRFRCKNRPVMSFITLAAYIDNTQNISQSEISIHNFGGMRRFVSDSIFRHWIKDMWFVLFSPQLGWCIRFWIIDYYAAWLDCEHSVFTANVQVM
jgi:hypothetical protein